MNKNSRLFLMVSVSSIASQIYLNMFVDGFIIAMSVVMMGIFLYIFKDLESVTAIMLIGVCSPLFRFLVMLWKGGKWGESALLCLPDMTFFFAYAFFFGVLLRKLGFSSYKNYASKTGIDVSELSCNGMFEDAMIINHTDDVKIILYNSDIESKGRILWSKAHELGHIVLKHKQQGEKEEIEANTFASQLLSSKL